MFGIIAFVNWVYAFLINTKLKESCNKSVSVPQVINVKYEKYKVVGNYAWKFRESSQHAQIGTMPRTNERECNLNPHK